MRSFRHHGIDFDFHARGSASHWEYDISRLGYNYRIPDINCALGISQLKKSAGWLARRKELAALYSEALKTIPCVEIPSVRDDCDPAWHLYVVRLNLGRLRVTRAEAFAALRAENIGVNVQYIPIP
jgi:dTDP-4-amino-4,6-dideoxygalactose transaminase